MTERSQNFCPSCGMQVQENSRFCSNCGKVLGDNAPPDPPRPGSIQTENVPVPPMPNTRRPQGGGGSSGSTMKNIGLGCGGILAVVVLFLIVVALVSPGSSESGGGSTDTASGEQDSGDAGSGETFTNQNYGQLVSDPDAGDGARVEITGQLLGAPDIQGGELAFQMFADPSNFDQNTIVYYPDTDVDVQADDYVRVTGTADGTFEGENAFGGVVDAVAVEAETVEVISAAEAVDPTVETLQVGQTAEDQGFSMTLERIEFGERTTRAYVTITNGTQDQVSFYSYGSRIVQGSSQVDIDDNFLYELPEPQSEITPGVTTEGAVVFGPSDPSQPMSLQFEWSSYDFNLTPGPVVFEVTP